MPENVLNDCQSGMEIEISSVPEDSATAIVEIHNEDSLSFYMFSYIFIVVSSIIDEF